MKILISALASIIFLLSCGQRQTKIIYIQPFSDISATRAQEVFSHFKKIYPYSYLLEAVPLPKHAYYSPRNRYRADSLIYWLRERMESNEIVIGLTSKDISTTTNNIKDFGVMGLGFRPGKACIASTYRLGKSNLTAQFFKVAIHELGHTQGLLHCPERTCFMRDAEGKNPTNEEQEFCSKCTRFLQSRGWQMQ
jgi:archaemetzincin